ncbi:MAG TPA: N-acetylmuramoyl-L-alanine amidase [Terriglobales bacterium]|nr:N-acetylmuramoyl-L-alanine amidase [Terriglobales bacterium]
MNNAGLELLKEETAPVAALPPQTPSPTESMGHEALQALLAFAALHEQVRTRRANQLGDGGRSSAEDDWQVEHFLLDEVLQLVAERALAITGADGVAIAWAEGDAIVCRASAGSIAPDAGIRLDPNSGFSGECLVSGRIVRCDDADTDPRVNLQACRRLGVRSMLAVPLSAKENVIGLLEAFSNEPYGFNDSDVRSLCLLAELILSAMKPEEEDRLREISRRVVAPVMVGPEPISVSAPLPEIVKAETEPPSASESVDSAEPASSVDGAGLVLPEDAKSSDFALAEQDPAEHEELDHSRPGLAVVAAVVLIAAALGTGVWWKLGHSAHSVKASATPTASPIVPPATIAKPATTVPPILETATETTEKDDETESSPATPEAAGVLPQVTGIRHWSSAESSTVVIDMQDQVQYEAHRLPNPERIYFDLHDTTLPAALNNRIIAVNDSLLQRIRVAQPLAGVTRVVLETNGASDFSVSLEPNPYRLVVEVRKLGTKPPARAKIDLFAPTTSDQTAAKQAPSDQVGTTQKPLAAVALSSKPNPPSPQANSGNEKQLASSLTSPAAQAHTALYPQKLRIVLDAGHGGWDLGTVGRKGLLEKDLTLDIVERLGQLIESRLGAEVIYTRKDDSYLALEKRAEIANLAQAGLFISVHANYSDFPSARGVETYYTNTYSSEKARTQEADEAAAAGLKTVNWTNIDIREKVHESRRVAISVQRSLYAMLSEKNPGLPNRGVKEAHYVVLTGTSMPAILAEVSFVSSPTDENNLQSSTYRQQIAEALYTGIAHYQASNHNLKLASASAKPAGR